MDSDRRLLTLAQSKRQKASIGILYHRIHDHIEFQQVYWLSGRQQLTAFPPR